MPGVLRTKRPRALLWILVLGLLLPTTARATEPARTFSIYLDEGAEDWLREQLVTIDGDLGTISLAVRDKPLRAGDVGLEHLSWRPIPRGQLIEASLFPPVPDTPPRKVKCHDCEDEKRPALLRELIGQTLFHPRFKLVPPLRILSCTQHSSGHYLKVEVSDPAVIDDTLPYLLIEDFGGNTYRIAGDRTEVYIWRWRHDSSPDDPIQTIAFEAASNSHALNSYCLDPQEREEKKLLLVMWPHFPDATIPTQNGFPSSIVGR